MKKYEEKEKEEKHRKIGKSKYNNIYKNIMTEITYICKERRKRRKDL